MSMRTPLCNSFKLQPLFLTRAAFFFVADLVEQTLTEKYEHIIEDYRRLKSDYEEVREAREKYKKLSKDQDKNPFVLMLVDGDGYNVGSSLIHSLLLRIDIR